MTGLPSLAQMTCRNEPLHIFLQHGPPESLPKIGKCQKDSPVANCLMCSGDEGEALVFWYDNLVSSLEIMTHKHSIHQEELGCILDEAVDSGRLVCLRGSSNIFWTLSRWSSMSCVYAFICDWLNNVCIVVASTLSCTLGWAVLKLAVVNVHVTNYG